MKIGNYQQKLVFLFLLGSAFFIVSSCFDTCAPPFSPRHVIDKMRVLAVQVEPPEFNPGDRVKLSFFAVDPTGPKKPTDFLSFPQCLDQKTGLKEPGAFWITCLPGVGPVKTLDSQCTAGAGQLSQSNGNGQGFKLPGKDSPFQLLLPPCGTQVSWTAPKDYLNPLTELQQRTGVDILFTLLTRVNGLQQITLKRGYLSTKDPSELNKNPSIDAIKANNLEISACKKDKPDTCSAYQTPANVDVKLEAILATDAQQTLPLYLQTQQQSKEDISIAWFTTKGSFKNSQTFISGSKNEKITWPTWQPKDYLGEKLKKGDKAWIWAVIHDFRGGLNWIGLRIELTAEIPQENAGENISP